MSLNENRMKLDHLLDKYNMSGEDKEFFYNIVLPIFCHDEFQKRMNDSEFPHHGTTSLGTHIISDAIVSFLIAKKKINQTKCNIELSTKIAMFHDLYELPWQNSGRKAKNFINKHGFTHPLEAIINAYTWYPEHFEDSQESKIIIDGVVHHMWPFPVITMGENVGLNNMHKYENLPDTIKEDILSSSSKNKITVPGGEISFSISDSLEGKIVCCADKIVSCTSDNLDFYDTIALVTGKNKNLVRKKSK